MAKTSRTGSKITSSVARAAGKKAALAETRVSKQVKEKAPVGRKRDMTVRDLEAEDMEAYLRLRQALDSFQLIALHYYGTGEDAQQSKERAEEVKRYLRAFMHQGLSVGTTTTNCPEGTRLCPGGDCVNKSLPCVGSG